MSGGSDAASVCSSIRRRRETDCSARAIRSDDKSTLNCREAWSMFALLLAMI